MRGAFLLVFLFCFCATQIYGQPIVWDRGSMRKVSAPASHYTSYPRMIELQDQSWLCIYESDGNIVCAESVDKGNSWKRISIVAERKPSVNMCVPSMIQLKDGSLLAMYNPRPTKNNTEHHFEIRTKKSNDLGLTWHDERLVYQAGNEFKNGCWEPAAIQLPDGAIQLFFANEGLYLSSDEQNISRFTSFDNGLTWSKVPTIVSFRAGFRDGMPVPLLIDDHRLAIAIEDNGMQQFKPYIIYGNAKNDRAYPVLAKDSNRAYALKHKLADTIYAGAPYLCRTQNGLTLLSYQGTEGRKNKMKYADMKVVVGDRFAANFEHCTTPFLIPPDKSALWNSLAVTSDGTVVALTATNAFGKGQTEIWLIKGQLKHREPER